LSIVGGLVLVVVAIVAGALLVRNDDSEAPATTTEAAGPEPFVWDVKLDPQGRPYDAPLFPGSSVVRRPLAVLHAPSRRVLFMGGEYLPSPLPDARRVTLAERQGRRYPVHAIWEVRDQSGLKSIVGVVVVERDTPIVRWRVLHDPGYVTDAGTGGITTPEWAARAEPHANDVVHLYNAAFQKNREHFVGDVDGHKGIDTIGFRNGWGDGAFPSIAGYDAAGDRVEIVLWTKIVPWRLAFPEGEPPAMVTKAEKDFAECLAGRLEVEGHPCRVGR